MKKDHLFWIYPVIYLGLLVIAINWDKRGELISGMENNDSKSYPAETTEISTSANGFIEPANLDLIPSTTGFVKGNTPDRSNYSDYNLSGKYDSMHISADSLLYSWYELEKNMIHPKPASRISAD